MRKSNNSNEELVKGFDAPRSTKDDIVAVDVIYSTTNLDHFKPNPLNRDCNATQVRKILKGIREGKVVCLQVIEVFEPGKDGKYVIADGNTRYQAALLAREEGIEVPIKFRIVTDKELKECGMTRIEYVHVINNDRKDWGLKDMVDYYIKDESNPERQETYRRLKDFCKEHYSKKNGAINYRYGATLLSNGIVTPAGLKGGELIISINERAASIIKDKIDQTAEHAGIALKNNFTESFIKAFLKFQSDPECQTLLSEIGYAGFFKNLDKARKALEPIPSTEYWFAKFREQV